jgi:hypothetical protein
MWLKGKLLKPFREMIFCVQIIDKESNPACEEDEDDGNGLACRADIHFEDFKNGLDAENDTDDVDDGCNHNNRILRLIIKLVFF